MKLVVLMGGKSSRMGESKAYLVVHGKTFLTTIIEALLPIDRPYISADRVEHVRIEGYPVILDEYEAIGPMNGIYSALHQLNDSIVCMPTDQPMITTAFIKELIAFDDEAYEALIVCDEEHIYPTLGIYHMSILESLRNAIQKQDYRLYQLLKQCHVRYIHVDEFKEKIQLCNLNTKEEYEAWLTYCD